MTGMRDRRERYRGMAAAGMAWMLDRPMIGPGFVNTKLNPIDLTDYGAADGLRGPDFTYGWIQGRALEALVEHAVALKGSHPALARRMEEVATRLHAVLLDLLERDGHVYFCYDRHMQPVIASPERLEAQSLPAAIYTFADIFAAKGLLSAAVRLGLPGGDRAQRHLIDTVTALEDGRFQIDERSRLGADSIARQPDDFGPRMILLGAADLLVRLGLGAQADFVARFISRLLTHHYHPKTGLLLNVPGGGVSNVGHAIEFGGFGLALLSARSGDPGLRRTLERIVMQSFAAGFTGKGLVLEVDVATGRQLTGLTPWWSLPEAIRAAALSCETGGGTEMPALWQRAHDAFLKHFWRGQPPVAFQMLDGGHPVDRAPATPDLDPGYHTGLCLLAAADTIERQG